MIRGISLIIGFCGLAISSASVSANEPDTPAIFGDVLSCADIEDASQRLDCYDESVARLAKSYGDDELQVVSRQSIVRSRRSLFGFPVPDAAFADQSNEDDRAELNEIETAIVSVSNDASGRAILTLEDGSTWEQSETRWIPEPKPGEAITIRRAALGSYMASIEDRRAFRMKRRD
ncbi:MAG: hypothetical protein K5799_03635 [Erythrobacter sp.]|nr:hypothetical protein [Erythrobacter sp.]